ncbi:MAG: hypothetical protein KF678_15435 [Phycisphaeraceae bacterium]|nr:hypothetical protein [Phycisphaeraceae bacterium]
MTSRVPVPARTVSAPTVPADRLFWSIVEASGIRAGRIPSGLWPLIEEDVPVDPEQLWGIAVPIDDHRIAACAIRSADLIDHAGDAVALTPAELPGFIPAPAAAFNFLVGEHEPRAARRARLRRHCVAAACTLLSVVLIAIGLSRRTAAWNAEALAARKATDGVIASIAPHPGWSRDDLALELMHRRQAAPAEFVPPADAAEALAGVLANWPTQVANRPQAISASGASASISVTVPGDAQAFLAALKPPEGWRLNEPRLAAIDKVTRLNLELRKVGGDEGEGTR